jgi:acetone carboxylase gamma subunit
MINATDIQRVGHSLVYSVSRGRFGCGACGFDLGRVDENFKDRTEMRERPVTQIAPEFGVSEVTISAKVVFREFLCPKCGLRLDTEIARLGDPVLSDLLLVSSVPR